MFMYIGPIEYIPLSSNHMQPENLLLDENSQLKISDFGLSALHNNSIDEATLTSSKMLHTSKFV